MKRQRMIEAVYLAHDRIPPEARNRTEIWMSRETLATLEEGVTMRGMVISDLLSSVLASREITMLGLPIKFDDRIPHGQISFETRDVIDILSQAEVTN